jgi:poly-beta-1,6-N-acetyl-D-glucosamine synthase
LVYSFIASNYIWLLALFLFSKTIIEFPFVMSVANFFNERKWMKQFILLQPLHILYTVFVGLISQFGKYEWKGRKVQ